MGQDDFVLRENWSFRETTDTISVISGTQEYDVSTEFTDIDEQNIIDVRITGTSARNLIYAPFNQLQKLYPDFDSAGSGMPEYYYLRDGEIGFYPKPNVNLTVSVNYYKVPTPLVGDSDTSIIPKQYRQALNHFAISKEHQFNTDPDLAQQEQNLYEQVIDKARQSLLTQPTDDGNFRVRSAADSTYWLNQFGDTR